MKGLVLAALLVVVAALLIGWLLYRAAWESAKQKALWRPASRDVDSRTEIIIQRVAVLGNRSEVLATAHVEWMPKNLPATVWEVEFAEAMGRAGNRAAARNIEID